MDSWMFHFLIQCQRSNVSPSDQRVVAMTTIDQALRVKSNLGIGLYGMNTAFVTATRR